MRPAPPPGYPHAQPEDHDGYLSFRVPSLKATCSSPYCQRRPVADMARSYTNWRTYPYRRSRRWWAYCAEDLAGYGRVVYEGRVWWVGGAEQANRYVRDRRPTHRQR